MPDDIDTRLTLSPNNQIAFLGDVENLVVGTEYDITAEFLRPGTRFVFKGRSDIALTRRPQGVPARQTYVEARVTPTPPPDDKAVVTPLSTKKYPYATKDRLDAAGLNNSFLPMTGGTIAGPGNLNMGNRLNIVGSASPGIAFTNTLGGGPFGIWNSNLEFEIGTARLIDGGPGSILLWIDSSSNVHVANQLIIGATLTVGSEINLSGQLNMGTPVAFADKSIMWWTRQNQPPGWRRLGITGRDAGQGYYPLEELYINATTTTVTGRINISGLTQVFDLIVNNRAAIYQTDFGAYGNRAGYFDGSNGNFYAGGTISSGRDMYAAGNVTCQFGRMNTGLDVIGNIAIYGGHALYVFDGGGIDAGGITGTAIHSRGWISADTDLVGGRILSYGTLECMGLLTTNRGLGIYGGDVGIYGGYGLHIDGGGGLNVTGGFAANTVHSVNWIIAETYISSQGGSIISRGSIPMVTCFDVPTATNLGMWAASRNLYLGSAFTNGVPAVTLMTFNPDLADITSHADLMPDSDGYRYLGMGGPAWYAVYSYQYVTMSDPSVKRDIVAAPLGCLDLVRAVEPKTYKLIHAREGDEDRTHWGFLAPDVAEAMDHAGHEFGGVTTGSEVAGLAYNELIAVLWGAVRELAAELAELKEVERVKP